MSYIALLRDFRSQINGHKRPRVSFFFTSESKCVLHLCNSITECQAKYRKMCAAYMTIDYPIKTANINVLCIFPFTPQAPLKRLFLKETKKFKTVDFNPPFQANSAARLKKTALFFEDFSLKTLNYYHVTIVCPTSKFHETILLIEREIFDINFTSGFVNSWGIPRDFSRIMQDSFGHNGNFIISISTENNKQTIFYTDILTRKKKFVFP